MKRFILIILGAVLFLNVNAQTYYHMWRGNQDSGKPEFICNSTMAYRVSGIRFAVADKTIGLALSTGNWLMTNTAISDDDLKSMIPRLSTLSLTMGVHGAVGANSFRLTTLNENANTFFDLYRGRGGDAILEGKESEHMLRIGGTAGIGFWGDGNVNQNDAPNVHLRSDGALLTSNRSLEFKAGKNGDPTIKSDVSSWLRLGANGFLAFWADGQVDANDNPAMLLNAEGNLSVGFGATAPYRLSIGGELYTDINGIKTYFGKDSDRDDAWIGTKSSHGLYLGTNGGSGLYMDAGSHNVYVGLIDSDVAKIRAELKDKFNLFVAKGVLSEDYSIAPKGNWSDFVFNRDYKLNAILDVETFIQKNNHLPDVPSAQQVAEEGYSQHEMNKILLQKIEELTLYTIQQQKEINTLKSQLSDSKK